MSRWSSVAKRLRRRLRYGDWLFRCFLRKRLRSLWVMEMAKWLWRAFELIIVLVWLMGLIRRLLLLETAEQILGRWSCCEFRLLLLCCFPFCCLSLFLMLTIVSIFWPDLVNGFWVKWIWFRVFALVATVYLVVLGLVDCFVLDIEIASLLFFWDSSLWIVTMLVVGHPLNLRALNPGWELSATSLRMPLLPDLSWSPYSLRKSD